MTVCAWTACCVGERVCGRDRGAALSARDRGYALAGSSTLNRLELSVPGAAAGHRYKKIAADPAAMEALLVELFLEAHAAPPAEIVLDLDATDDPLHGRQEGRFFHGYYGHYCYLPLYVTCGDFLLCARLRPANRDAAAGSVAEVRRIVTQIRRRWPHTRILVRGDAGFCRDDLKAWCEADGLDYVFGLARNARLQRWLAKALRKSRRRCAATGRTSRRFRERRWRTRTSWTRARRVVGKAEWLPGLRGNNPRFVVTTCRRTRSARRRYTRRCTAGAATWKPHQGSATRLLRRPTSTATMRANQLRLTFATFASVLMALLRRVGLAGTALARARPIRSAPGSSRSAPASPSAGAGSASRSRRSTRCRSSSPTCSRPCARRRPAPAPADPPPAAPPDALTRSAGAGVCPASSRPPVSAAKSAR